MSAAAQEVKRAVGFAGLKEEPAAEAAPTPAPPAPAIPKKAGLFSRLSSRKSGGEDAEPGGVERSKGSLKLAERSKSSTGLAVERSKGSVGSIKGVERSKGSYSSLLVRGGACPCARSAWPGPRCPCARSPAGTCLTLPSPHPPSSSTRAPTDESKDEGLSAPKDIHEAAERGGSALAGAARLAPCPPTHAAAAAAPLIHPLLHAACVRTGPGPPGVRHACMRLAHAHAAPAHAAHAAPATHTHTHCDMQTCGGSQHRPLPALVPFVRACCCAEQWHWRLGCHQAARKSQLPRINLPSASSLSRGNGVHRKSH